jgi:hypothetical protein
MAMPREYHWLRVTIDGEPEWTFPALVDLWERWNGFLCPLLPRAEADRVAATANASAARDPESCATVTYDPVADVYVHDQSVIYQDPEAVERIAPVLVDRVPYYQIGSYNWVWTEAVDRVYTFEGPGGPDAEPLPRRCDDCGRPTYLDTRDGGLHHALRATEGCAGIAAEERPDDPCHPLTGGWLPAARLIRPEHRRRPLEGRGRGLG